ncbi:MAG: AAA+ superfamily protein [candidate division TM6 bacterium GW2011_GWF2_37_49]|nr:MAG: AAA+ superfamily protein [candidate division TM6 bacterium GW2011_GWF2_37_49]
MFIERDLAQVIKSGAKQIPILAITGPRQSGKSTLIKKIFNDYVYLDMQDAEIFEFANNDPKGFLNSYKNKPGVIIDEAQYAPNLFSQLKVEVDKDPRPGYYILSGSQNFLLHEKISESLAGRVYFYTLLPLSIKELKSADLLCDRAEAQIYKGFYPRTYQPQINAQEYYENYISTYVERDIRSIRNIDNILNFKKFMQLCALRIGSILNFSDLATNCGISVSTAKSWFALLETSFILYLLPSYHDNLGKRVTKSPKLYFYDTGLAAALMGVDQETIVQKRTIYGALFENMIIIDLIKQFNAQGLRPVLTFFRDSNNNEIDLIIELAGKTIPVEIKASETINSRFFDTIAWFKEQTQNQQEGIVVYGGNQTQQRSQGNTISWKDLNNVYTK